MVEMVYGGVDAFDALVYGQQDPRTVQYLHNQVTSAFSSAITQAGQQFYSRGVEMFERYNGSEAMRIARAALRKVENVFQQDTVRSIFDLGGLQNAPLSMQRFIMAEPTVRQAFQEQRIDGYSPTYRDMNPGTIGESHYDYRRVMHGVVQETVDDDGEEDGWKVSFFIDDLEPGDQELSLEQKDNVISTWDMVRMLMEKGEDDPTSPFAGKL